MKDELAILAEKLRTNNLIFEDSVYENFLWEYAVATMAQEGIQTPDSEENQGYLCQLMKEKAEELVRNTSLSDKLEPVRIKSFGNNQDIIRIVRIEHGLDPYVNQQEYHKSLKTPSP
ncbi:hypothetical protein H8D91_01080 [archaeon]|nr:hypothetical protein [archaeon]